MRSSNSRVVSNPRSRYLIFSKPPHVSLIDMVLSVLFCFFPSWGRSIVGAPTRGVAAGRSSGLCAIFIFSFSVSPSLICS
jgi:hypothetical protein